jgi:putative addiction module component (TIGR02574 family)
MLLGVLAIAVLTVALATASLLCSVWTRQTRDAILACYATVTLVYLASLTALGNMPLPLFLNPQEGLRLLLTSSWLPWSSYLLALAVWAGAGALCLFLAVGHLRKACLRLEGRQPARWLWALRPRIGNYPIRWREQHVIGLAPLPWLRIVPTWMGRLGVFIFSALLAFLALRDLTGRTLVPLILSGDFALLRQKLEALRHEGLGRDRLQNEVIVMGVVLGVIGALVVGVRSATSVSEEKRRKTWEDLILTPLTVPEIVEQKKDGILLATLPCMALYVLPMLALSALGGRVVIGWAIIYLFFAGFAIFIAALVGTGLSMPSQEDTPRLGGGSGKLTPGDSAAIVTQGTKEHNPVIDVLASHYLLGETRMPVTVETLGIDRLSVRERLDLIEQIWDSLPETIEPGDVPPWHLEELARRRAEAASRPNLGKPWREVEPPA